MRRTLLPCLIFSVNLICLFLLGIDGAQAGKPSAATAPKRFIFSRPGSQSISSVLGLTGVPAYVNLPDGRQKLGVYVTKSGYGTIAMTMGLTPGTVLISIENRVIDSVSTADSALSGRRGSIEYSYIKMSGGVPTIVTSKTMMTGAIASAGASAVSSSASAAAALASDKKVVDTTSVSTLESFMVGVVNSDRSKNGGLSSVSGSSRLADLARDHAAYVLSTGRLSHTDASGRSPEARAKAVGIGGGIAENVAMQPWGHALGKDLVSAAEAQMMAEPASDPHNHRANILWNDAKGLGVGIAHNDKMIIFVQDFADSVP